METRAAAGRFPTTSWTRIRRAGADREELGVLLTTYWGPVYSYLRRKGHDREAAADLTQGFLTDVLLERDLLGTADQQLGRFRTYLLTALGRYVIDVHRREHGRAGSRPPITIPTEQEMLEAAEPDDTDDPVRAFDRQWATTILNLATERVEADCRRRRLDAHWAIYEARIHRPACYGCEPAAVDQLSRDLGVSESEVYSMLNTVRRKIRSAFEAIIMETLERPEDLDAEFAELRRVVSMPFE